MLFLLSLAKFRKYILIFPLNNPIVGDFSQFVKFVKTDLFNVY